MTRLLARTALVFSIVLAGCGDDDPASPPPTPITITSGVPVTGIAGAENSQRMYVIAVPAGATRLLITTGQGSGDVDMYVRRETPPSLRNPTGDCASTGDFTDEMCDLANPTAGNWYILLFGWESYSGVTLTATVTQPAVVAQP